jgi:hypothetical protein
LIDGGVKRALRVDIDEAAWSSLYSRVSRPFEKLNSGKIAVKVINHYGDEVMKVFGVQKSRTASGIQDADGGCGIQPT